MRRMRLIVFLCLLLLFVPIYLWKVQGITIWRDGGDTDGAIPQAPLSIVQNPGDDQSVESLARKKPVAFLEKSLAAYKAAEFKGYTCTLVKQERINGKLNPQETIECWFREKPYSVMMHWTDGAGVASASLFVMGANDGKMCIRLAGALKVLGIAKRLPDCKEAKDTSRYLITEFGLRCGTERTYKAWKALQDKGVELKTEYVGLRKNVEDAGGRDCHVIKRYCEPPEEEGLTEITIFLDAETLLQVGTILKAKDDLIGRYFFKDIKLNPKFDESLFKVETLKKY